MVFDKGVFVFFIIFSYFDLHYLFFDIQEDLLHNNLEGVHLSFIYAFKNKKKYKSVSFFYPIRNVNKSLKRNIQVLGFRIKSILWLREEFCCNIINNVA